MITNESALRQALSSFLLPFGFGKGKRTWQRSNEDVVQVIDLQKSQWGGQYYVNIGIYLKALGSLTAPKEYQCQLRTRLGRMGSRDTEELESALNLENREFTPHRDRILTAALSALRPFLEQNFTVSQIKTSFRRGDFERFVVTAIARDFLSDDVQSHEIEST